MRYIIFILALSTVFLCCKKNTDTIKGQNASEYFPNSEGDYWKYKYVDSLANSTSYVEVKVVGSTIILNGQTAKVWTFKFTGHTDTNYVYKTGDTVKFLNIYMNVINTYVIPLVVNNKWENAFLFDSIKVLQQDTLFINKNSFTNSFLLNEKAGGPNYHLNRDEWFCPYVGMLTKKRTEFNLGPADNSYWEIEEYNLK